MTQPKSPKLRKPPKPRLAPAPNDAGGASGSSPLPAQPPAARRPRYQFIPRAKGTSPQQQAEWRARHHRPVDPADTPHLLAYFHAIVAEPAWHAQSFAQLSRRLARHNRHPVFSKAYVRRAILALADSSPGAFSPLPPPAAPPVEGDSAPSLTPAPHVDHPAPSAIGHPPSALLDLFLARTTTKPVRTLSGVAPITVLTAPRVCPGRCIFCPDDVRMPRSYLSNEPGAMRALMLDFDPYAQVESRLSALARTGHTLDKAELLILGGTWSDYPRDYQEWFVRRLFDALNQSDSPDLLTAHRRNETATHRCTGLVVETRPDFITPDEVHWLRYLGVTRVQIGAQSLSDDILYRNGRAHPADSVRTAIRLLRSSGFKVALHMMPNLLGATPATDLTEWELLWSDPSLRPDEAKLYPTDLLRGTPLYDHYLRGEYIPYDEPTLLDLLVACKRITPKYVRLNRVMRDIPAPEIAAGVTTSNMRQIAQKQLREQGRPCRCIRCREVRGEAVDLRGGRWERLAYPTDHSTEVFLSAVTGEDKLAGFLRLSLPTAAAPIAEIDGQAVIRQVQVYGPALALGEGGAGSGKAQHQGLGKQLIEQAREEAREAGFTRLAVIAAVGTRNYYRGVGFEMGELYMSAAL